MLDNIALCIYAIIFLIALRYTWRYILGIIGISYLLVWIIGFFGGGISVQFLHSLQIDISPVSFLVSWVVSAVLGIISLFFMSLALDKL